MADSVDDFRSWENEMMSWAPGQDYSPAHITDYMTAFIIHEVVNTMQVIDIELPPRPDTDE